MGTRGGLIRIQTAFTTEDQFVSVFRKLCTENTCFLPSVETRTPGTEAGFSIRLANGTPMLRGLCVVLGSWCTDQNPYQRPGSLLGIRTLTLESRAVFERLQPRKPVWVGDLDVTSWTRLLWHLRTWYSSSETSRP